jgi:hypothetical protein
MLRFDWDERENKSNRAKHDVWFEEAQSTFDDPHTRVFYDPEHSEEEDRFHSDRNEFGRQNAGRRSLLSGGRLFGPDHFRTEGNEEAGPSL